LTEQQRTFKYTPATSCYHRFKSPAFKGYHWDVMNKVMKKSSDFEWHRLFMKGRDVQNDPKSW
jgi:hypothetical protein